MVTNALPPFIKVPVIMHFLEGPQWNPMGSKKLSNVITKKETNYAFISNLNMFIKIIYIHVIHL